MSAPPVQGRADAIANAHQHFASGEFLKTLERRVAYKTESQNAGRAAELRAYLEKEMQPAFAELDFESRLVESPSGKSPFLIADYREGASLPTVLVYGHGDVVDGMEGEWRGDLDPFKTTKIGNRVYGRGTADNKGQHSINLAALRAVREARGGKLGFNAKFLVEMGEEIGSPDLNKVCASLRDELKADLLLASDGPRLAADRPTIFLGCRGGIRIHLDVNLREGGHHSGNWGGVLANPATILANAIASLVDERGRMKLDALKPPRLTNQIRSYLADVEIKPTADEPALSENWGEEGLSAGRTALRLEHAGSAGDVVGQYRQARQRHSRPRPGGAAASLRGRHQASSRSSMPCGRISTASGFPMVEVERDAKLHRLAHGFRQPLDRNGRRIRSGRPPARRPPCCRISAARCRTTCSRRRWACRRSGCRIPIPAARSMRPTSTSCSTSPRRRSASWRGCSGISARGKT